MRELALLGAGLIDTDRLSKHFIGVPAFESYLRNHFVYRSENREVVRTVSRMLSDLALSGYVEGDCDDVATFIAAVLSRMGVRNRFVAIRYGGSPEFLHVFVEWWSMPDHQWVRFDPTVNPGTIHQEDERMVVDVL